MAKVIERMTDSDEAWRRIVQANTFKEHYMYPDWMAAWVGKSWQQVNRMKAAQHRVIMRTVTPIPWTQPFVIDSRPDATYTIVDCLGKEHTLNLLNCAVVKQQIHEELPCNGRTHCHPMWYFDPKEENIYEPLSSGHIKRWQ